MAPAPQKPQKSVTISKKKDLPKKALKKAATSVKSKSKSPVKAPERKRDVKAAQKVDFKMSKIKRSVSAVPI